MKKIVSFLMIAVLVVSAVTASMLIPANDMAKEKAKAPEKSPAIGDNWDLERADFVHYARPDGVAKPAKPPKQETCYKLMGIKWNDLAVDYVINPANPDNLTEAFIVSAITSSAETWDSATSAGLLNIPSVDYSAQYGVQNLENAISFGNYPEPGVIGVTSIWYTRRGKKIVEFDMLLDTDYIWGDAAVNPSVMDLENIGTHEMGHALGMDDIYSDACSTVTMYGYSDYGETSKRSLEQPDITGLQQMYGP